MTKKIKQKRIKNGGYDNSDTKEIKNLILITLGIAALALGLYFLTDKVLNKETDQTSVDFDYTTCTIGMMFNRPYSDYYVFAYDSTKEEASDYNTLILANEKKDDAKKVYFIDLSLKFNSDFVSDKSNTKPLTASEVKIKDSALIHIVDGKVANYYESVSDYEKVLK